MNRLVRFIPAIVYGSFSLAMIIAAISFYLALSLVNRPFPGFIIYQFARVGSLGETEWTGARAGIKLQDKIVSVDGRPVHTGGQIFDYSRKVPPGTPIQYTLTDKNQTKSIAVPTSIFNFKDFIIVFFLPYAGGLALLIIGLIVYIIKPAMSSSWIFYLFCFNIGVYMNTAVEIQTTYYFVVIHYLLTAFQGSMFFHLGLIFPEKKRMVLRHPSIEFWIYLPAVVLALLFEIQLFTLADSAPTGWTTLIPNVKILTAFTRIFIVLGILGFTSLIVSSLYRASSTVVKKRAQMILFGVTLAFLPTVSVFLVVHLFRLSFPFNYTIVFVLCFPAIMAYAIIRHNLFDADTIIRRTVGYAVVTAILVGSYVLISLGLNFLVGGTQLAQSKAFPILFTLVFILVFNPLRNRVQSLVDRIFFRKEYDPKAIIDRIGAAMTSLLDLPQILKQLVYTFSNDMFIDNSAVLLLNPATASYRVHLSEGDKRLRMEAVSFQRTEALPQIIENEKKELTKYDVMEDPKYKKLCLDCAQNFSTLYASLIIPMVLRGEVIGFISLGDKKSGKFYNREDIDLLRTLASQGAVAIENARMADQMKNEELVRANLARYLSPQIVDQIIQNDVQVNLGGDRKEVTVLFSDIRNFTSISESMKPEQLVEFLNEYFTEMARIIFANQGSLNKYIGDAIAAVFGSLIPLENSAEPAVKTSVEMMREMVRLNERWKDRYGFNMEMGIGVNTGEVFLGNIGSPERMEFTVIGDTVNTASRFSSLAKGRQVLATRTARDHLGPDFQIRQLTSTMVKGKAEEVEVFEILYD